MEMPNKNWDKIKNCPKSFVLGFKTKMSQDKTKHKNIQDIFVPRRMRTNGFLRQNSVFYHVMS
jgi:hypothetical protein